MDEKQQISLQKQIIAYFEKYEDAVLIEVIDSFVYHKPAKSNEISLIIEGFIKDNGLTRAYVNYLSDVVNKETKYFSRSSGSEISMIDNIKAAFMNAAYNRFRHVVDRENKMKKRLFKIEKGMKSLNETIAKVMDAGTTERYYEGLDELKDHYLDLNKE